jgi:hypothetical protein
MPWVRFIREWVFWSEDGVALKIVTISTVYVRGCVGYGSLKFFFSRDIHDSESFTVDLFLSLIFFARINYIHTHTYISVLSYMRLSNFKNFLTFRNQSYLLANYFCNKLQTVNYSCIASSDHYDMTSLPSQLHKCTTIQHFYPRVTAFFSQIC